MKVGIYIRISTDEDHQPYSLEAQTERLTAFIRSQEGWELARRSFRLPSGRAHWP